MPKIFFTFGESNQNFCLIKVEEEIESHIDGKEKRIVELKSQYSIEKRRREEAESDLETQQHLIRTLKSDKLSAAAAYKGTGLNKSPRYFGRWGNFWILVLV